MTHAEAKRQGFDTVYPEAHALGQRIFYDFREGKFYDAGADLYMGDDFDPVTYGRSWKVA